MRITGREFARWCRFHDDDALVELTATTARENAPAEFSRAFRVLPQRLRQLR